MVDRERELEEIVRNHNGDRGRLLDILWQAQEREGFVSHFDVETLAQALKISPADVREVLSFYHFFRDRPSGRFQIYLDTSALAEISGLAEIREEFERELGIKVGQVTPDGLFGLYETSCIGMSDQSPAALINLTPFTRLDRTKVRKIISGIREGFTLPEVVESFGYGDGHNASLLIRSMVRNNIRGPELFLRKPVEEYAAINRAKMMEPEEILSEITKSGLRGCGGAGFPVGRKWSSCRTYKSPRKFVVCNADEGEPGTFKDRYILTEHADLMLEGMAIAGRAIGAREGLIYLRAEYKYLLDHLNDRIAAFASEHPRLDFSFRVQLGAGAYVCGEASALLESMEGKRGEPRLSPPRRVEVGYMDLPTTVNNVESYALAAQIINLGADTFRAFGTEKSPGTRLLSVSGDVLRPGIYEIPWGTTIGEVLGMTGAVNPFMVQVGGPSGICIRASDTARQISYEDLPTGGSFMVFSRERNQFAILQNYMNFFVHESCGNCTPCRAGNVVLRDLLDKFAAGHARHEDIEKLDQWSAIVSKNSRCGLGETSPNVLTTSKAAFPELYESAIKLGASDLFYDFNTDEATGDYDRTIRELK